MGVLLAISLLAATLPARAAGPDFSDRLRIDSVHGPREVKVVRAAGAREQYLSVDDTVFVGDEIHTVAGQIVGLKAWDKSEWKVAPLSRLKLESRKPDKKSLFYWTMDLIKGGMWGDVKKDAAEKDGFRLKVKVKHSSMGVRGTEYLIGGDEKLSTLDVLEGEVWWGKDPGFAAGTYRAVKAGQHAETGPDGKVTVHSSQGDKAALAARYGVVPAAAGERSPNSKEAPSTIENCRERGKGWKSTDGSPLGECSDEGDKE